MIFIDPRAGSGDKYHLFPTGTAELSPCDFADFSFAGNGPDGPMVIGIESKTISECVSSMRSGRLAGEQLPKLLENVQMPYLILVGRYLKNSKNGLLRVWHVTQKRFVDNHANMLWDEFQGRLTTLDSKLPVRIRFVEDDEQLVTLVLHLHDHYQRTWEAHDSYKANYLGIPWDNSEKVTFSAKVLSLIPGLGWKRACSITKSISLFELLENLIESVNVRNPSGYDWTMFNGVGKSTSDKINEYLKQQGGK